MLGNIFRLVGRYDVVMNVDTFFLQMFLRERFGALSPKLVEFKAAKPEKLIIDGVEKEKTCHYKPQGLRWFGGSPRRREDLEQGDRR